MTEQKDYIGIITDQIVASTNPQFAELNLTAYETKVLSSLISCLYAEKGFSDVGAEDLAECTGTSTKQVRGAISSLVKKRLVMVDDGYGSVPIINLHYSAHHLHPTWGEE
jgi:hypothetical protein